MSQSYRLMDERGVERGVDEQNKGLSSLVLDDRQRRNFKCPRTSSQQEIAETLLQLELE